MLANSAAAINWARVQLAEEGEFSLEPICSTSYSRVTRLNTKDKSFYLKEVVPDLFREPLVMHVLSTRKPEFFPPVISGNRELRCFLTPDVGIPLRQHYKTHGNKSVFLNAVYAYAKLQLTTRQLLPELQEKGVPRWDFYEMEECLAALVNERAELKHAYGSDFNRLAYLISDFTQPLFEMGLPYTIEHVDFHDNNILIAGDGSPRFIDWGEAVIAHPFFSLYRLLASAERAHGFGPDHPMRDEIIDAYMLPWQEHQFGSKEALLKSFEAGRNAIPFYRALCYAQLAKASGEAGQQYWKNVADDIGRCVDLLRSLDK